MSFWAATTRGLFSVQIEPILRIFYQPDGREFMGRILGDEFVIFYETADGFSIEQNSSGFWCYAKVGPTGTLIASEYVVLEANPEEIIGRKHVRHATIIMEEIQNERKKFFENLQLFAPRKAVKDRTRKVNQLMSVVPETYNLAVLLIEFPDVAATYSPGAFDELLFSEGFTFVSPAPDEPAFGSMFDYYQKMSNGRFAIKGEVFDWVVADHEKEFYENQGNISSEVLEKTGVDLTRFDGFTVIYSGTVGSSKGNLWPKTLSAGGKLHYLMSEKWLQNYDFAPIGVHCHEFGHLLGLPDLYDIDFSTVGVGNWCTMGSGNFGRGHHERPFDLCAWSKETLGWLNAQAITAGHHAGLVLPPVESERKVYKLISFASYFLLENRQKIDYDLHLPGDGLLIWHIDERFGGQSIDDHRLVDLEEADGEETAGDAGDPFPGKNNNVSFGSQTFPSSEDYNGQTYVEVSNISLSGDNIQFEASIDLGPGLGITVNNQGDFPNIFTAIEAAFPNGEVFIPRGHYFENNLRLKNGVVLRGEHASSTIIDGQGKHLIQVRDSESGGISHLSLINGATGVVIFNSNVDVKYNVISDMSVNGVICFNTASKLHNNTIVNVASSGISCLSHTFADVRNNILAYYGV
ncbi:MAG: M6 family metalloprotease domain-containing protein [Desulfobacterales bacterium]